MTSRRSRFRLMTLLTAATCLMSIASASAEDVIVHDARGHDVTIGHPTRIVAVGGALTEILYALGVEDRIVAIDSTSLYPPQAMADKPNVGYMRQLSAEGILGLHPQLVLAIAGSGPKETIDVIDAAKVPLIVVPETFSEDGMLQKIRMVARVAGVEARGECLADAVAQDLGWLRRLRAKVTTPPRVMFVMSLLDGRAMAAGRHTAANEIIALAGGVNAIDDFDGYKIINEEAIVAARPDHVLAMERGKEQLKAEAVFANPAFALTPAARARSFVAMDGLYLLGFGPRTAAAARDLAARLDPALAAEAARFKPASLTINCRQ
ncbi:hemin ABC transporter substrate-binding protein [Rhodopseudomonas sp. P2A-2r]|uniref:heme/hemin ABC transporter substrate-binding protein n=1 Tax=Rhodopseudomonas sp. P2A-2r TaxID=2991972 RepID=UPI002233F32A|nr:hemin ABC transporter substrate-binding protein [Rhodopseudomonas sp. P2A-2r]UZE50815.1 hemin ABC transporter substrate-binding protein [Rhodopseudomonas sp. P2A-2r]